MTDLRRELGFTRAEEILFGHDVRTGRSHYLPMRDLKETSVHIVGAAGFGKSYFLRSVINQLIVSRQVFGLIDPHRELVEYALWRLRRSGVRPERIVLLDPGDSRYSLGFNPLSCGVMDPGETSSLVIDAFQKAWGASSFDQTPRLERTLRGLFRMLIESRLSLLEGYDVLNPDNVHLRRALRERVTDRLVQQDWLEFERLPRNEKVVLVESSRNRLARVLHALPLQAMLGQTEGTLDLRDVLDSGKFLLANLGSISAPETQRLVGSLLMNGIFHAAKQRDSRRRRSWFLICDEFGQFATADFANSLDQLRKFGCHLILAHQRLAQLEREGPDIASAVMTNARVKFVMGGLERQEAERMAKELFTGQVRGDRVKHISMARRFMPVLDTFEVETQSETETESDSEGWGQSEGHGSGSSEGNGSSRWMKDDGFTEEDERILMNGSSSSQSSRSESMSASGSRGTSRSRGSSRSVVPITRHEEFQEETGRQFYGLDEEWEERIARVHGLPKREALVRVYGGPVLHIKTPNIEPERCDERMERFQTTVLERCPQVKTTAVVTLQIEGRRREIAALAEANETAGRPFEVKTFRE